MVRPERLVGREAERAVLADHLARIETGEGAVTLLVGEPGIGKSRLLDAVRALADARGLATRSTSCVPLATPMPLEPVAALLRLDDTDPAALTARRERFTDALQALRTLLAAGPSVLQLDDLQWADQETISFLRYVIRRNTELPVHWILASRPSAHAQVLADDLRRLAGPRQTLQLGGLSLRDLTELAGSLDPGRTLSAELLAAIHTRCGGNPFLATELLRELPPGAATTATVPLPAGIRAAVAVRRQALAPPVDELLRWLALLPEPIQVDWLVELAGAELQPAVEALVADGFVTLESDATLGFRHDLLRDAVAASMLAPERRRRHDRIAEVLRDAPARLRVPQLRAAGRRGEAATLTAALADQALLGGGAEDAISLYLDAEALAGQDDAHTAGRARAGRVLALLRAGQHDDAHELARQVRRRLAADGEVVERARFLARYAMAAWDDAADLDRAHDAVTELEPLQEHLDGLAAAEALLARAHISNRAGRTADALELAQSAASMAAAGHGQAATTLHVRCLVHLGLIRGQADSAAAGLRILEQAIDLAQQHAMPIEEGQAWLARSFLTQHIGDTEAYERFARRGLEVSSLTPALEAMLLANAAQGPLHRGELTAAIDELERAVETAARAGRAAHDRVAVTLVHALVRTGAFDRAESLLAGIDVPAQSWEGTRVTYARALLAEERGDDEQARTLYAAGSDDRNNPSTVWSLAGVVRACCRLGDLDGARAALARLEELRDRWPITAWLVVASEGSVAVAAGERERGAALLEAAADRDDVWFDWRLKAAAALARKDAPALTEAITRLEAIGAQPAADRAREQAAIQGVDVDGTDAATFEVQVLGPVEVHRAGEAIAVASGHPRAVVALLAVAGPQRIEQLSDRLWPTATETEGRRRLRQVLYRLRRAAPGLVVRGSDERLRLGPSVTSDLQRFELLLKRAQRGTGAEAWQAAVDADALVRGPVAVDVTLPGGDEPLDIARTWLTAAHQRLLDQLAAHAARNGEADAAIAWRLRAVDGDPDDETAVERLVAELRAQGRDDDARDLAARATSRRGVSGGPTG